MILAVTFSALLFSETGRNLLISRDNIEVLMQQGAMLTPNLNIRRQQGSTLTSKLEIQMQQGSTPTSHVTVQLRTTPKSTVKLNTSTNSVPSYRLYPVRQAFPSSTTFNDTIRSVLTGLSIQCTAPRHNSIVIIRNGLWYVTQYVPTGTNLSYTPELSIFGAYLDDRDKELRVRVIGVSNTELAVPVHCQLWYTDVSTAIVSVARVEDTGRGYTVSGRQHQERLYTCTAPNGYVPHSVSLAFDRCYREAPFVPVHVPVESVSLETAATGTTVSSENSTMEIVNRTYKLGVCVAVIYGSLDALNLIEWFEMNMLLGVSEFNMYTSRVDSATLKVLRYYLQRGVLRLNDIGPPVDNWCKWCQKLATISVLNDCMYRNMYRYDNLMVIDTDEFLIPRQHQTILALVKHIEGLTRAASYLFPNAYFFSDKISKPPTDKGDLTSRLQTVSGRKRLKPSDAGYATKSIINPRYCISIQNHYCVLRTANTIEPWALFVNSDLALLHHYKNCSSTLYKQTECSDMMKDQFEDNDALVYKEELLQRITSAMTDLKMTV